MTMTLIPFDGHAQRRRHNMEILSSRGGLRDAHYRKVRRRRDPNDTTPFDAETKDSVVVRASMWWDEVSSSTFFWKVLIASVAASIFLAALIVLR
jgi:hypothetical protein